MSISLTCKTFTRAEHLRYVIAHHSPPLFRFVEHLAYRMASQDDIN